MSRFSVVRAAAAWILCSMYLFSIGIFLLSDRFSVVSAANLPEESYDLPILMYHSILPDTAMAGSYVLPPEVLEADLQYLASHGYETVTVQDLLHFVDTGAALPEKPILLSFDDGYYNNCIFLPPLMERYEMCAVVSPVGSFADEYTQNGQRSLYYAMADWDSLKSLAENPHFELQNHSYALHAQAPRMGAGRCSGESEAVYQAMLYQDLSAMQSAMQAHCGVTPQAFVYPFGAVDEASGAVLRELGFRASFSCSERHNRITRDPECLWLLGRYNRPYGISTEDFMAHAGID